MIDWDNFDGYDRDELLEFIQQIAEFVELTTHSIRMGVYDEQRDGNLLEVLEEIERILR